MLRLALAALVALAGAAPWASGLAYPVDLLAQGAAQASTPVRTLAGWWVAGRWWPGVAVVGLALVSHGAALTGYRASRVEAAEADLRIVVLNMDPHNPRPMEALELAMSQGADVVVLTETPREVFARAGDWTDRRTAPDARYPHVARRRVVRERSPRRVVLSRWALTPVGPEHPDALMLLRVDRPSGRFLLANAHPSSPRSPARWRDGNEVVRRLARTGRELAGASPLVVAGDLNAAPTGWRSRHLCSRAGVRRAKPLDAWGTFPARWPAPARVAIDDVWADESAAVGGWRLLAPAGSDHRGVVVDLALPGG